ncbi:MAG: hypoxanthine phosphoribosyltransferase [Actinobacteria bacterium]|nr:hypoxanthine phosphoribosyltransferase [Actinomycetota bacterium]
MKLHLSDSRIDRVLLTGDEIAAQVADLGSRIVADYAGRDLVLITVLKGGLFFLADLCRSIDLPLTVDFMAISSYGPGAESAVRITKDLDDPIEGRDVLMVEDIIDTGLTLNYLMRVLRERKPASLAVCTLLDKDVRRLVDLPIEYRGFRVPDRFLVGYGLDLDGVWRNLPYVATLHEEVWER